MDKNGQQKPKQSVLEKPEKAKQLDQNWSVDFVEHLRMVHFALIAISVTLMVLAAPPNADNSKALSELSRLIYLQEQWPAVRRSILENAAYKADRDPDLKVFAVEVGKPSIGSPVTLAFLSAKSEVPDDNIDSMFPDDNLGTAPPDIEHFREWWNQEATHGIAVVVPDLVSFNGDCHALGVINEGSARRIVYPCSVKKIRLDINRIPDIAHILWRPETRRPDGPSEGAELRADHIRLEDTNGIVSPKYGEFTIRQGLSTSTEVVPLSVLNRFVPKDWPIDSFDQSFPHLASVPKELQIVPLKDALLRFADLQPKGEQYVEIVGLKVPTQDLVQWGALFTVAVQIYFWLHLHELSRKLDSNSPGLDVAWIGVYRSRAAILVVLFTACILPIMAYAVLVSRVVNVKQHPDMWDAIKWALKSMPGATVIASTVIGTCISILSAKILLSLRRSTACDGDRQGLASSPRSITDGKL